MVRTDHIDLKPHRLDLLDQFENQRRIKEQDIGKVFLGMGHNGFADLIVKQFPAGVMLTEGIAGRKESFRLSDR